MRLTSASIAGFTLLEILVATALMAIGFAGNYALFTHSTRQHSFGLHLSRATHIASSLADELAVGGSLKPDLGTRCSDGDAAACAAERWRQHAQRRWQRFCETTLPECEINITTGASITDVSASWREPFEVERQSTTVSIGHE